MKHYGARRRAPSLLLAPLVLGASALSLISAQGAYSATTGAVATTGAAVAWGDNGSGQLGTGSVANSPSAVQVNKLTSGTVAVAVGGDHSLALNSDGTVVAWGSNFAGQLGNGTNADSATPSLTGLSGVVAIAAGDAHSLALLNDGTIISFGSNDFGQLGNGTTTDSSVATLTGLSSVRAIAAGGAHSLGLLSDGSVIAWGDNSSGQLGLGSIDANPHATANVVSGLNSGITAIAAGSRHNLAVRSDGTVVAWGANEAGQLGNGTRDFTGVPNPVTVSNLSGATAVAAGAQHSLALRGDGSVLAWGYNFFGQLGIGTTCTGFACGSSTPVQVSGLTGGVLAIAAGGHHSVALKSDGTVVAWGMGRFGELGNGSTSDSPVPVQVQGATAVVAIAAAGAHNLALQPHPGLAPPPGPPLPRIPKPAEIPAPVASSPLPPPTNVRVTPATKASFLVPSLAQDPLHPGHLALSYYQDDTTRCWLSLSSDNGASWSSRVLIGAGGDLPIPQSASSPSVTLDNCQGPVVGFGPDGTLYYAFLACSTAMFNSCNVFLTASTDGGLSFRPAQQVDRDAPASNPTDSQIGGVVVDQSSTASRGHVYITWTRFGPQFGNSVALSATCTPAEIQAFLASGSLACESSVPLTPLSNTVTVHWPIPAVGPDGRFYVAWTDASEATLATGDRAGPFLLKVASSTDRGKTFTDGVIVDRVGFVCPNFGCPNPGRNLFPVATIASGPAAGQVFVGVDGIRKDGKFRVSFSHSSDSGATWSAQIVGVIARSHEEHAPHVSVAPGGRVDVGFYDLSPDSSSDAYAMSSSDGGAHFSAPRKLDDVSSSEDILGINFADTFFFGLVSNDATYTAVWADSRRGTVNDAKTDLVSATATP